MKQLPKLSEMEHITSKELGENLDVILDRITSEDIAMVMTMPFRCAERHKNG